MNSSFPTGPFGGGGSGAGSGSPFGGAGGPASAIFDVV